MQRGVGSVPSVHARRLIGGQRRAAIPRLDLLGFASRCELACPFVSELPGGVVALDRG
jgi:hypothetical protein